MKRSYIILVAFCATLTYTKFALAVNFSNSYCKPKSFGHGPFPYSEYMQKINSSKFKNYIKDVLTRELPNEIDFLDIRGARGFVSDNGPWLEGKVASGVSFFMPGTNIDIHSFFYGHNDWGAKLLLKGYTEPANLVINLNNTFLFCENNKVSHHKTRVSVSVFARKDVDVAQESEEQSINLKFEFLWDVKNDQLVGYIEPEALLTCDSGNPSISFKRLTIDGGSVGYFADIENNGGDDKITMYGYGAGTCELKSNTLMVCNESLNAGLKLSMELVGLDLKNPDFINTYITSRNSTGEELNFFPKADAPFKVKCR